MTSVIQVKAILLLLVALIFVAFTPASNAVNPPPDGGYPNQNTAEGNNALFHLSSGARNTAVGFRALYTNTASSDNTAVGWQALLHNTSGTDNTSTGAKALFSNTTGGGNTATGYQALSNNTIGFSNTANGAAALSRNTTGSNNTAVADSALLSNVDGFRNNAFGISALVGHQTGSFNNAFGALALASDLNGVSNNAFGDEALRGNISGSDNTAMGDFALHNNNAVGNSAFGSGALKSNHTGTGNTAIGTLALASNIGGEENTATGIDALSNSDGIRNTADGAGALQDNTTGIENTAVGFLTLPFNTSGSFNVALGSGAGQFVTTASNVICIGDPGLNVDNSCFIGNIWAQPGGSQAVFVNSNGKLGAQVCSRRFKHDIEPMDSASEALLALKPVTFRYNKEIDPAGTTQFGLVAEDVEKVNPGLVIRDKHGEPYSVRYDQVNAMLLNEFLKAHRKIEEQEQTISQLKSGMEALTAMVKEQTSQLQRVSAQLELSKPAPQTVLNNQWSSGAGEVIGKSSLTISAKPDGVGAVCQPSIVPGE